MRIHILANGLSKRYGSNKNLVKIWGVPNLRRTCEMFAEDEVIVYSSNLDVVKTVGDIAMVIDIGPPGSTMLENSLETLQNTAIGMNVRTYGDVVWSPFAYGKLKTLHDEKFVGRRSQHGGEIYSFTYHSWDRPRYEALYKDAIKQWYDEGEDGSRHFGGGGWLLDRRIMGVSPYRHMYNDRMFVDLDLWGDWTMDIDFPEDYEYFRRNIEGREL